MKNKFLIFLTFLIFIFQNILGANEFKIESSEINVSEKGNITSAKNGIKIISNDGIEITGEELIYNKEKSILKVFGDVKINDQKNNIFTEAKEIIYYKNKEKIISKGKTKFNIKNNFFLESLNLVYERNLSKVYSENKSKIEDLHNNIFFADKFKFDLLTSILKAKNLSLFDNSKNQYYLNFAIVDLKNNKFLGSDISVDFEDNLFGNTENDPRLKGNSIISNKNETEVYKGSFTTCKKENEKCPPWMISAEKVVHKKKEKKIEYKNAWLKIYDKPVLYFPYFFHPDPTVKRQSGFLMPGLKSSNNSGTSLQIPYFKVISENKDITFSPRLFFDNEVLVQTEYRQANRNSDLLLDFSINNDESGFKRHFFGDVVSNRKNKNIHFHLESVSNDNYLKEESINSPIVDEYSTLHSYLKYNTFSDTSYLDVSLEVYEDLNKKKSNRYEYIFPNFIYEKDFSKNETDGSLFLNMEGYQKNYDSNVDEAILKNDLIYSSFPSSSSRIDGLQTNYKLLLRNINSNADNSTGFNKGDDYKLLSSLIFESYWPLKKENNNINQYLTPKISLRYSPNSTKNNTNANKNITYERIYTLDRIDGMAVEGGESITWGLEYSAKNKKNNDILNFSFATIYRLDENPDLPKVYGISEERSDFIGDFKYIPSKFFDLNYQFSIGKNLDSSSYNLIKTNINVNNFVTSFEFLEEDNYLNQNSYLNNTTKLSFDDNNSIKFGTSKNLDKDITEYYNLIYEYENDCLTAEIEYNKSYYTDGDLKPEENIIFSIKLIPFGKVSSGSKMQANNN